MTKIPFFVSRCTILNGSHAHFVAIHIHSFSVKMQTLCHCLAFASHFVSIRSLHFAQQHNRYILRFSQRACVCVCMCFFSRLLVGLPIILNVSVKYRTRISLCLCLRRTAMNTNTYLITNIFTQSLRYGHVLYFALLLCNRMLHLRLQL